MIKCIATVEVSRELHLCPLTLLSSTSAQFNYHSPHKRAHVFSFHSFIPLFFFSIDKAYGNELFSATEGCQALCPSV